jgi:tetratricopeptide (TPR) repeat protein
MFSRTLVSDRPCYAGHRKAIAAYLIAFFLVCCAHQAFAETKTFVAFSMKAAQTKVENAVKSGDDFRKTQLDLYQLGGITKPWAIVLDRDNDDWIIVGERDVNSSILTLDDLAVALRARFLHADENDPGVTINPPSLNGDGGMNWAGSQTVRFFGGVEKTHFGEVCFEADWLLKRVSFGIDKLDVDGLKSYYDFLAENQMGVGLAGCKVASRFWFLPTVNRVNVLGDVILLEKFKMGVFTEVMYAELAGKPVADLDSFQNTASDEFARSFSDHYDAAAKASDVLDTLRGLTRLAALAKGLTQAENKPDSSYWLHRFPVATVDTPETTQILSVQNSSQGWQLSGGVRLAALAAQFKGGDAQALKALVLKARPNGSFFTWHFDIELKDGQPINVLLPNNLSDPDRVAALADHAWFLYQKKRYQDALEGFDAAFGKSPELAAESCWAKGIVMREYALLPVPGADHLPQSQSDDRLRQAVGYFDKCVQLNPHFTPGQYELGVTLRAIGNPQGAIDCFQKVIDDDKDYGPAYFGLGLATATVGDSRKAIEYLKQFIERAPTGSYADDARSEIQRLESKLATADQTLKTYQVKELSIKYPNDWVAMTPDEVGQRVKGNMVLTPDCVLVVANPDNWGQNVNIQIKDVPGSDSVTRDYLTSVGQSAGNSLRQQMPSLSDFSYDVITVAGVPALKMEFSSIAWGKKQRQRSVAFVKHEKMYTITFTALDEQFTDAEAKAFRFILDQDEPGTGTSTNAGSDEKTSTSSSIGASAVVTTVIVALIALFILRRATKRA